MRAIDIINRARVYLDDDHNDTSEVGGLMDEGSWLAVFNAEYHQLYRDWVRLGLIAPAPVDVQFTGHTATAGGVLATVGIAEVQGGGKFRALRPAQSVLGRAPFWDVNEGCSRYWYAHHTVNGLVYTLEPRDTGTYLLRYIPVADTIGDLTEALGHRVPFGLDERLALGLARRANVKYGTSSALLERLIMEADARVNMQAFSSMNGDSPRVRRVRESAPRVTLFNADPRMWWYH